MSKISDEERQLFRDAMRTIRVHNKTTEINETKEIRPQQQPISIKKPIVLVENKPLLPITQSQPTVSGSDIISFSKSGLQHQKLKKLRKNKKKAEATLDLHGLTSDEAIHTTDLFLQRCKKKGLKNLCIIHGKGNYSIDNKPVLKNIINHFLRQHPLVIAFHSANADQGGTGAVMVFI